MPTPLPLTIATLICTFKSRSFHDLPTLFAPDATYWVQGHPPLVPYGGSLPAIERFPALIPMLGLFEYYDFTVLDAVVDERTQKQVALRLRTVGRGGKAPKGVFAVAKSEGGEVMERRYENYVAMVFRLGEDGKVEGMREYLDNYCPAALFRGEQVFADEIGEARMYVRDTENQTERIIRAYIEDVGKGEFEEGKRWFDGEARYWVNGRERELADAGWMGFQERLITIRERFEKMSDVKIEVHSLIVDGDRAVTETTTSGYSIVSGARIEDTAVTFWTLEGGRIKEVFEFGDHVSGRP